MTIPMSALLDRTICRNDIRVNESVGISVPWNALTTKSKIEKYVKNSHEKAQKMKGEIV